MMATRGSGVRPSAELTRRRNFLTRWWLNLPMRDKGLLVVVRCRWPRWWRPC